MTQTELILKLYDIEAVKFGQFKLVSGIISPIYLDLKTTISYPEILKEVAEIMWQKVAVLSPDLVCGVPYTALPFATAISIAHNIPMVMRRKEKKNYGISKNIEGSYQAGQNVLIIEDLVTSGTSVFETILPLETEGLVVKDIVVLVDREQGGKKNLEEKGYRLHSVVTISEILETLEKAQKLSVETVMAVKQFIAENQVKPVRR